MNVSISQKLEKFVLVVLVTSDREVLRPKQTKIKIIPLHLPAYLTQMLPAYLTQMIPLNKFAY